MASVEFADAFNINDNQTPSTYPHILFQKKTSGDSTIPYLHCIYSEAPSQNYYEVGYHKLNLNQTGGGGQQGGEFTYLEPKVYQCAPNPFSKRTSIRFQIGQKGNVNLKVYDIQGRLVRTLISGEQKPGIYTVVWDGKDGHNRQVPNGVYFYRLDAPGITDTKKTVLMR